MKYQTNHLIPPLNNSKLYQNRGEVDKVVQCYTTLIDLGFNLNLSLSHFDRHILIVDPTSSPSLLMEDGDVVDGILFLAYHYRDVGEISKSLEYASRLLDLNTHVTFFRTFFFTNF